MRFLSLMVVVAAANASAARLDMRIVSTGNASAVGSAATVAVYVQVRLDGGGTPTTAGLAVWSATLHVKAFFPAPLPDVCDTNALVLVDSIAEGLIFENCNTAGGTLVVQGGPYDEGEVHLGIGNGGWQTVAEGEIHVTPDKSYLIYLESVSAETIDSGQVTPPFTTTAAILGNTAPLGIWSSLCEAVDTNCDGSVAALDIAIVVNPANWLKTPPACDRADVNQDGSANVLDIAVLVAPSAWLQMTTPGGAAGCTCISNTPTHCPNVP